MDNIKVKNIFAAVFDKSILDPFLVYLQNEVSPRQVQDVRFWGTEGTMNYVKVKGYSAKSVVSGFDFDGRVKSLDKRVFARILADRTNKKHMEELASDDSAPFDLVVVDLYPLDKNNFPESMDVGGQALIRAAIKNYKNVALAFDGESVKSLVSELTKQRGETSLEFRKTKAQKAAKFIAERAKGESELSLF